MAKTVHLVVELAASAEDVFDAYLNPKLHAKITGHPVVIALRTL